MIISTTIRYHIITRCSKAAMESGSMSALTPATTVPLHNKKTRVENHGLSW